MATQAGRIAHVVDRLAEALYARVAEGRIVRADLVHARPGAGGAVEVVRRSLLPLDLGLFEAPARHLPPLVTLPPATLLARLAAEQQRIRQEEITSDIVELAAGAEALR